MPVLKDPRREQFAQLVASGKEPTESYRYCGYSPKGAAQSASRLNKDKAVSSRIAELRQLAIQIPQASSWLNENFVLQGLKDVFSAAMEKEKFGDAVSALNLMGKRLGLFNDRRDNGPLYPDDISSLDERQRTVVMRWLARMAYPDDPAAAEAALQLPSGTEVIETRATAPDAIEASQQPEVVEQQLVIPDEERFELKEETPLFSYRSWADLDPGESRRLAAEWKEKVPGPPLFITKEQRLKWMNENWPLEQEYVESDAQDQVTDTAQDVDNNGLKEPLSRPASWADITDPEERRRLAAEWAIRGPQMPELPKEERVAWLDENWPLQSRLDW